MKKEDFERMLSTDSIREKVKLLDALDSVANEIIRKAYDLSKKKFDWWSWKWYEGENVDPPDFDSRDNINGKFLTYYVCGRDIVCLRDDGTEYNILESFPIHWIWTDNWEVEFLTDMGRAICKAEKAKQDAEIRRKELKRLKSEYILSAREKLTPEEMWAVGMSKNLPNNLKHFRGVED